MEEFSRHEALPSYYEFGKSLSFEETSDSQAVHYDHHSITLHPGVWGATEQRTDLRAEFLILP